MHGTIPAAEELSPGYIAPMSEYDNGAPMPLIKPATARRGATTEGDSE